MADDANGTASAPPAAAGRDRSQPTPRPFRARPGKYVGALQVFYCLLRNLWPIPRLCIVRWAFVTRYDDVVEVLTRHDVFAVPFGAEIARLNDGEAPGTPFILGIDDKEAHDRQLRLVMNVFRREDIAELVTPIARKSAVASVAYAENKSLDAIRDLIIRVPLALCEQYYGVKITEDAGSFAGAACKVSGHLFGAPPIKPKKCVDVAATRVRKVVDEAIARELATPSGFDTILARLVAIHRQSPADFSENEIRAFLLGMIIGFVPTNTMASGHMLEMLLSKPEFMDAAVAAARAGDDDLLRQCLFEALRFMPENPGPFRICQRDYIVAADTPHAAMIRKGTKVLPLTPSAMFDSRQVTHPYYFNPGRPASDNLSLGYGMHWCVGVFIARAQITQTFKPLLLQPNLRRAPGNEGKLATQGGFPVHLVVRWGAETS